jgi:hypothetical protein
MVISIMEYLTVFYAKINVMHVLQNPTFVYHVTELIGFHGQIKIMIAYAFMAISTIIRLIAIYVNVNALLA